MNRYENYKLKWEMVSDALDRKNKQIYELSKEVERLKIDTIPKEFGTGELLCKINELQGELEIRETKLKEIDEILCKIREMVHTREYSDDTIILLIHKLFYSK